MTPVPTAGMAYCFACGRRLYNPNHAGPSWVYEGRLVDTRDDQTVIVGPECYRKVKAAGEAGYQPPRGGPRLWLCGPLP